MKKQIIIIGIIVLLIAVGLSGCTENSNLNNEENSGNPTGVIDLDDIEFSKDEINNTLTVESVNDS